MFSTRVAQWVVCLTRYVSVVGL